MGKFRINRKKNKRNKKSFSKHLFSVLDFSYIKPVREINIPKEFDSNTEYRVADVRFTTEIIK